MSKGFQDAVWNGLDTRRYDLENMPEYTPPEDVGYIKSIGQNVLSGIESTLGGAGMFIGANMASGSPDYSKGGMMGKASNVGRDFGAGLMNESQYLLNDAEERQAKYGASPMDWGGPIDAATNLDYWLSPRGFIAEASQGIGSSIPTLLLGGIGGKVASPLLSIMASTIGKQALKKGAASAAGKALSYMGGFGVGSGASEAISDAGSNYNDILQNLQGKVNPDGTPMYDEQGAMTEATRRMNDLSLSEMPYLMASDALTGGLVAGKMSKLLGQDSKSIGRRALANVFGAGADMTGEGFTEVAQTTLANDAMDKPSGDMWNPRKWDKAQLDSFRGGFMGSSVFAGGGGAYHTVFGGNETPNSVEQIAPQVNNNLFGAGTAEISTQGADIDEQVAHLKDGYQSVIPQVAGVLVNDFGIEGAQISSGFRTREHNKEVGGAENSYHVGDGEHGDALDIVLPDGVSAETAEAIKQRFKDSGVFDEVLFHDAGSGYHLHLGGLKTDNIGNSYGSYSGNADVDSAINEMAEKYNLDPALLAAIAEQESGFNQSAQSEAGAMGIMQLMPGTAEGLGVDPSDLRGNLEGGAKYLRQMLDKYDGDVEKALAAYNAGPGSLDSVNGDISQLSGETQKYVPSVMERYNKFKNKSGGGISSSGNILDWDSTNEDFSKLDFFPKDGEQSQGTVNEFLENLAKLEESDDKATKEKGRQAQDILQQYGDDTEKLTEKAKELGYQQTVDPAEVHGRIPMRRIVSTALNNGQVTFATKKAADIFASSPIGQTMERQGKTFKVTDNFKMNEQVNAISQQIYSGNTARTKTVSNGVTPDVASQGNNTNKPLTTEEVNSINEVFQSMPPALKERIQNMMAGKKYDYVRATMQKFINNPAYSPLSAQEVDSLNKALQTMPEELRSQIQGMMANEQYDDVRAAIQKYTSNPANKLQSSQAVQAGDTLNALLNIPEAMSNSTGTRIDGNKVRSYIESGNLPMMNRAINAMSQNLREHGMDPQKALGIYDVNTLPAVQGERMPSTDVQREEPAIEGTVEDTVITPPYNGKPAYNENQLEAPAIESDHLNSEDFLAGLSPVERGFMEYLDKMFDNLQLGFNDVLEYLRARQKDIFNKRMESVIQQGPQGLTGAFYTNGGKMVVDNNMPKEVQNAWNQLLSMRKNFGASLANSTAEIQNEYMRVESVVKDYLTTAVTEQCKNNVSWRKLKYAITGLEAIADKARRYERSVSEEGKRGSTKSYRDVSAEEGQAIEDSAVAWSGAIHQYGTTETRLRSFLNTLGSNFTKNNHGMALRAKTKYKGQPMNKAGRIEALIRDGGRVEERGKEYFAVSPNGDETKVTKGEHNYYKWLRQNGFAQHDRAPEGAPQLAKNNGVTEDNYRARQPEYNGKESYEEDVKKEESIKGQTKPQSNDNPNASNEPMRKELIEQAAANEDTWVNSKKSELHLEDDNDTVVKLTPQELKYYQDLVKKGVVAKPELYEEAQEDVGEMDDNVEMSKEQKQLYDESSYDRDMPNLEDEAEPTTGEPHTKYSREKSPVDEKNNQQENVTIEFEADTPAAQKVFDEQLTDEVKRDLRNTIAQQMTDTIKDFDALSDDVKADRAFSDLPIVKAMRVTYQIKLIQNNENNKSKIAARYEYARRCFLYDERVPNGINRPTAGNKQQKQMAGNLQEDVSKRNQRADGQRFANDVRSGSATPSLGEYKFIKKQFDKLVDDKLKHSSRDKSAFSIEPINPHSAESLKENGNSNTELDRLPKVPIAKLRQSEQKIVRFGKAIGVPVHFVESSDTTNRGLFTHNGEIFINRKAKVPAHSIFVHEFVHWLKASPENAGAYDVLHACLENSNGLFNEARINKYRNKIFDGNKMTDEEIVEEIICDAMTQTESAEKLMRAVNNVDSNLVTRIAGCLKAMWDKFCEYMNFKQHKMSNEQHLPNELSVAEFQRADTAFNKILMDLKNDNGEPVFHRVGTELLLRDTNAKPVEAYQINPISYTYAVAYSKENDSKISTPVKAVLNMIRGSGLKVVTDVDEMKRVLGESLNQSYNNNLIQKLIISYEEGDKAPDLTLKKQDYNGKQMYGVAFVGNRPKNYIPKKIGKAYKLMEQWPDGSLHALFAGTDKSYKIGEWNWAQGFTPDEAGGIKSMKLAPRYGWHMGTGVPATHHLMGITGSDGSGSTLNPKIGYPSKGSVGHPAGSKRVWVEVHYDATNDYSDIAASNPGPEKDIRGLVPFGGYYMFQESNLSNWIIASSIKFDHVLTEKERQKILDEAGYDEELVWRTQVVSKMLNKQINPLRALVETGWQCKRAGKATKAEKERAKEILAGPNAPKQLPGWIPVKKSTEADIAKAKRKLAQYEAVWNDNQKKVEEKAGTKDWAYKQLSEEELAEERAKIRRMVYDNPDLKIKDKSLADNGDIQYFQTAQGEVYGFVKDGVVYVDTNNVNANIPVHEFTHVWDKIIQETNPELWERGKSIMKQLPLWKRISESAEYADIAHDENLLASEVHARLTGESGERILNIIEKKNHSTQGIIYAFKAWAKKYWQAVKDNFTQWSSREANKVTLEDFINMPLSDLAKGANVGEMVAQKNKDKEPIEGNNNQLETVNLAGTKNNGNKYSRGVDLSPSTDGVAIAARANNNLVANMKGIVKKANAKFNPFHHEDLENLRIDKRDEEKDLNLIEYQFVSPTREGKKYKVILPFITKGKQAMAKQEKLRFEFNEGMNEVDKLLGWREGFHRNDSKFKERKEALNEILLKGDLEGKEFTNDELIKAGYDAETIKGYRKMRALLDKAWKLANDTKSRIKYQSITSSTLRRAEADFADLKDKNPFAEIISKVHNPDGTVTINYKAPHVRRVAKQTVLPSELENLRKNKDVHIVETTQSLKGTTQVTYYQREAGMGKLKGYIPHVFHGWYVCKVDKDGKAIVDEDGNVAMDNIVTTANSLSEAAKLGRELAKANPNANYRVVPQTFSAPGAQEQAIVMGDFDYAKIVGKVADSMSMSITDAQAMLDNTVKMKNRGRFYGYAKQRKGFKGFEQNVYLATMKYFNQTARYAAMDSFKRDSISMYNRIFGAFNDENVTKRSAMAKWTKQYISDMNGTPTWIEKMINNTLHNFGLGEERAGGRPALWLQQKIFTYPMTILKLGVFNPSSALLNLTQLFNLYGAMGEKVLSPKAYQRLLHKGFADTFRAMSNKDSELGRLLWKDLGLDYQIGMDVASGYSNAEVNNLASLRGFAGRLAGKSMYLFRQSDAFARGVTLLTAYNKALDEGKSKAEAIEYAKEINDKVNFDYSVADEPTIFRALGPISKVFLQFKKYPVKQLELFQDFYLDGRELGLNRKQAALRTLKYMAPYMAMSGMMGIPFVSLAGGLLSALVATATGDDDWDWEKKIKQYMITEFGEDSPITQWWLYGAGSFIGLNLGSRVGVGDFMGSDSYNSADGLGGLMWNQTTLGSTINQVRKQLSYRNYAEALKAINPTLGNIALAYKGEVRTTRGRMKYQYQNMAERMWRAIGFTPLNETLAGDLASNEYAEKQEQTKAKQKAIDDFLADPSSENAARLNELGVTPKSLENESARRTMNRHQLNELAKEKEAAKKKKKPKTYSASDYLKAVQ